MLEKHGKVHHASKARMSLNPPDRLGAQDYTVFLNIFCKIYHHLAQEKQAKALLCMHTSQKEKRKLVTTECKECAILLYLDCFRQYPYL